MEKAEENKHLWKVDVLRGLAFVMVFSVHFLGFQPNHFPKWGTEGVRDYTGWSRFYFPFLQLIHGGYGVLLFFVISGFCIHYGYLCRKDSFTTRNFIWRRVLRLYPAYLVNMVVCISLIPIWPDPFWHWLQVPLHLLFIHNLFLPTFFGINGVYWSLGVEFQFYLLYPVLLVIRKSMGLSGAICMALVLNILNQLYFSLCSPLPEGPTNPDWANPLSTWCDWILGAGVAEAYFERRCFFSRRFLLLALSGVLFLVSVNYRPLVVQAMLFASVFFAVIIEIYLRRQVDPSWWEKIGIGIGLISYSLYLWHPLSIYFIHLAAQHFQLPFTVFWITLVELPLNLLVLIPFCWASWYFIERGVPSRLNQFLGR